MTNKYLTDEEKADRLTSIFEEVEAELSLAIESIESAQASYRTAQLITKNSVVNESISILAGIIRQLTEEVIQTSTNQRHVEEMINDN